MVNRNGDGPIDGTGPQTGRKKGPCSLGPLDSIHMNCDKKGGPGSGRKTGAKVTQVSPQIFNPPKYTGLSRQTKQTIKKFKKLYKN